MFEFIQNAFGFVVYTALVYILGGLTARALAKRLADIWEKL